MLLGQDPGMKFGGIMFVAILLSEKNVRGESPSLITIPNCKRLSLTIAVGISKKIVSKIPYDVSTLRDEPGTTELAE